MSMAKETPEPRAGMPDPRLSEQEFKLRFRSQFQDPAFEELATLWWMRYTRRVSACAAPVLVN
jgi:hypothetical protein